MGMADPESAVGITAVSLMWGGSPRWVGRMQLIDDDWLLGFVAGYSGVPPLALESGEGVRIATCYVCSVPITSEQEYECPDVDEQRKYHSPEYSSPSPEAGEIVSEEITVIDGAPAFKIVTRRKPAVSEEGSDK